jgi:asparagine synthase (glutamine-hydrolysing)
MSGIIGLWHRDGRPVHHTEVRRLSATLVHRGSDAEGVEIQQGVGFACRLSRILPEAAHERQPLVDPSGVMLVFDGRLDNRDELISILNTTSAIAADSPDPALVMACYRAFGDNFPAHLEGDFALGLYDPNQSKLLLARDPVGVRPIHYYASRDLFVFASEIKTLLAHPGIVTHPNDDVVADLLFTRLAAEDTRGVTCFQNIFSVLPAHLAIVNPEGIVTRRYWDFDVARQVRFQSFDEYAAAFRHYFQQAVQRRLRGAGPVAVSVSGGLDSSAIFCLGETLRRSEPVRRPRLLGVSYTFPDGSPSDEKTFLGEIERAYDVEITRMDNLPTGIMDGCREAIWHAEAPFLDAQWSRTQAYLTAVRGLGAKVLLTGHWGDQFLFDDAYLVDLCRRGRWLQAWQHINAFGEWVDIPVHWFRRRLFEALLKQYVPGVIVERLREGRNRWRPTGDVLQCYTDGFRERAAPRVPRVAVQPGRAHAQSLYDHVRSRYHVLCMEWNNKVGAMHGLDMAFPFLDRDLIAFLMAIPGEALSRNGVYKGLLRHALQGVLPPSIAHRTSKADFTGDVNEGVVRHYDWLAQCLHTGGMATGLGYVKSDPLPAGSRPPITGDPTSSELSWALGDLLSLELWLQGFFGPKNAQLGIEVY